MSPYIKEWGADKTEWKETTAKGDCMHKKAVFEIVKLADHLDQLGLFREAAILDRVITPEEYKLLQDKAIHVLYRSGWDSLKISEALSLPVEQVDEIINADRASSKEMATVIERAIQ